MKFKVSDTIIAEDGPATCICADESTAVFAPVKPKFDPDVGIYWNRDYSGLYAVSNYDYGNDFKFIRAELEVVE